MFSSPLNEHEKTIYIVDDSSLFRSLLKGILESKGFHVEHAQDCDEALRLMQEKLPQAFILDINMPGKDGFAFCRELKSDSSTREIPVIFITGSEGSDVISKAFDCGANDYVRKPFNAPEVLARIHNQIDLYRAKMELKRLHALALDSNPLTKLPGNTTIFGEIESALDAHAGRFAIYSDLDNFKAFNDTYGFTAGDDVIRLAADVFRDAAKRCDPSAFLGHIGGDDFVALIAADKRNEFTAHVIEAFDRQALGFYNEEDRQRGFIESADRHGIMRQFPIVAISLVGLPLDGNHGNCAADVAGRCSLLKKKAKALPGSVYYEEQRHS